MPKILPLYNFSKQIIPIFSVFILAQAVSGCVMNSKSRNSTSAGDTSFVTGSTGSQSTQIQQTNKWAEKWAKDPADSSVSIGYARSLRATGNYEKAVQVLQQASLRKPKNQAVIAEYGKALSNVGKFKQAMHNFERAHTLGQPDWRIYSAQGITLDRMEQHKTARTYYKSALNLNPNQSSVLNNIGLSYALEGDLVNAETYLRRARAAKGSQPKTQKNLALILGLSGKFSQSATASNEVLNADDTAVNIAYLKTMLSQPGAWQKLSGKTKVTRAKPRKTIKRVVAAKPQKSTTLKKKKITALKKKQVPELKKVSATEKPPKADKLKLSTQKPVKGNRLSKFSDEIEKAIAATQKVASVDAVDGSHPPASQCAKVWLSSTTGK